MSTPTAGDVVGALLKGFTLDLRKEARQFFRQRFRVAGIGIVLGVVFAGVGSFEVGVLSARGFTPDYLIALFLVVLGLALVGVSLYMGLLNPVTRIRGNSAWLVFERRWGRPLAWKWKDPEFRMDIDDRTSDPVGSAESHQHLFFEGPDPAIYGNLTPSTIGLLLDAARAYGAPISMKQLELSERGEVHLVRRIRIRPVPAR